MTYTVPSLDSVWTQARNRMRAEMPGTDASIFPSTNYVISKTMAGEVWELYQFLDWIRRQRFATTADGDQLDAFGSVYSLTRNAATAAVGNIVISATPLTTITKGSVYQRSDGISFVTTEDAVVGPSGSQPVTVVCSTIGAIGNTLDGVLLTPIIANSAVVSVVTGPSGIGAGAEVEGDASYRARLLARIRNPPQGGAASDYVEWALSIPGITRVWVDPTVYGPGTVGVWIMSDGAGTNGIPNATLISDVIAYISAKRPVTARVFVLAPKPASIDIAIDGILPLATTAMQAAILAEITDVFRRVVQVSTPHAPYTFPANLIWQAVARATGQSSHTLRLPVAETAIPVGFVPTLGNIYYEA